jgi:hypothetical protein
MPSLFADAADRNRPLDTKRYEPAFPGKNRDSATTNRRVY